MKVKLPPGLSQKQIDDALAVMREAVGSEWVIATDNPKIAAYFDLYSPEPASSTAPAAAVMPASVEEVRAVVLAAAQHRVPLWTISTGKNFAYGGPAPRAAGQIVLDLRRMNRILEVNTDFAYALVEPGVTYTDLYRYLREKNLKLWIDPAANGLGGILGNTVDHGAGYTPYGDHLMMQCGMEIVLADGSVVRTGMGALPSAKTWQIFKFAFGPWIDGLFTQSNFGVVTKLGIWLMPEPPAYKPFMVAFENEDDLHQVTELVRPLKINMVIPNAATTVHLLWEASVHTTKRQYSASAGPLSPSALRKIARDFDIGMWNFYAALYGLPEMVENNWKVVEGAFRSIKGARIYLDRKGDPGWEYRTKLMRGEPNLAEFCLLNWVGGGGHINFSPISPTSGEHAMKQFHMIRRTCEKYGFDYIGEFLVGWREMHHILMLMFNRTDAEESRRAHDCFRDLINEAAAEGYGEYRTNLHFMDQIAGTYNAFDGSLLKLHQRIKRALDPLGILSPGKNGIWPLSGSPRNSPEKT